VNNLDKYLIEFVANFEKNGGKVIWATDAEEAKYEIIQILNRKKARGIVKSKSMATEEIELNDVLESNGFEVTETDLGEYIVQLAGEKPYHIVTPAMHKSKEDVAELFAKKLDTKKINTPEELTGLVRDKLRQKFLEADVGISGTNFLIAETGSLCLTENEGNGFMSVSIPKTHIAIAGVEKIIPSLTDLHLFWPLLASYGTGQHITVYNSILTGPKQNGEKDGPEELYLVLLENNRSEVLKRPVQRSAMMCIKCGACLNACPVYKNIGGHSYA
jgi:L-lactate dehydrogenase complex protein LldF